jgi:anaerobic selenocysteine-containing dehydrogenase
VALHNAMIHTVIDEGLTGPVLLRDRASNFDALRANVAGDTPKLMAPICRIPAAEIREVARAFATAKSAMVLWGMGVNQHVHDTDRARCLIALVTVTGQIGKPGLTVVEILPKADAPTTDPPKILGVYRHGRKSGDERPRPESQGRFGPADCPHRAFPYPG